MRPRISVRLLRRHARPAGARPDWSSSDRQRALLGAGAVVVLSVLLSIHFLPDKVSLEVGDRSPIEVRASRSVTYVDTEATLRRRQYEGQRVGSVYDPDPTAVAQAVRSVQEVFQKIARERSSGGGALDRRVQEASAELGAVLTPAQIRRLLTSPPATLERLEKTAVRLVETAMEGGIRSDTNDLRHARADYDASADRAVATREDAEILKAVGAAALRPTLLFNRRKTAHQRELVRQNVRPIRGELRQGDVVIRPGEIFTQRHLDQCRALGLINPRVDLPTALSIIALSGGVVLLVVLHIRASEPALWRDTRRLALFAGIVLVTVFGLRLFGTMVGLPLSAIQNGYHGVAMVVASAMLIAVLISPRLALLTTALLALLFGIAFNHDMRFAAIALVGGLVGIITVLDIRDRTHWLRSMLACGASNTAMAWIMGGLLGDTLREAATATAWGLVAAAIAGAVFWLGVAVLEKPFGILTRVWLLELSASERPLLRQLCLTAPGTYAHSILVGNLAEAAAEAVGADALFCRVASCYHDIGKMRRPHCFVENQGAENIHDRLSPSLSALIIAAHVRDGIQMAEEHRLPRQIRDVIAEHHGTSLIRWFYHQALVEGGGPLVHDPILEQRFRYGGPKPQSRESGIIMLADSVEAAARSLDRPNPARVQGLVESIVAEKLRDGQLDECDLTFKDIRRIQEAFVRILSAMLHGRIDYPELPRQEHPSPPASAPPLPRYGDIDPELAAAPREDQALAGSRPAGPARRRR